MNNIGLFQWIESTGGPLVILEEDLITSWHGLEQPGPGQPADYERACAVNDYVAPISVGARQGIVLGEAPFRTTWWLSSDGARKGFLVRWVFAETEVGVCDALKNLPTEGWEKSSTEIQVSSKRLLCFDAACSGA